MSRWATLTGVILAGWLMACGSTETTRPAIYEGMLDEWEEEAAAAPEVAALPEDADQESAADGEGLKRTKQEMLKDYEEEMRFFLGKSVEKLEDIRVRFRGQADQMKVPYKIQAVETELAEFYRAQEEAYEEGLEILEEKFEKEMTTTLAFLEPKVWEVAFQIVGTEDLGSSYGSRTGIDDIDDIAMATLELLHFRSGLTEFKDNAQYFKYKRISMDRIYKHDVEGQGRLSIFVSEPMNHFFRKDEDALAITVAYQRKGLDPGVPLEFRQAVRNRIVRGGTTRYDSKFHWDETLNAPGGKLILEERADLPQVVVSKVFYPRVNMDAPNYEHFRDYTAIRDYKTAVVNADTREILDCVSWQYKWVISHFGRIAVEKGSPPTRDEEATVIRELLKPSM